ncbi:DUF4190 domain-containing protein [Tenggerimyces flavus]|uniref:DUF4190 domain-containing protein n=1 Tax=Tenggerimyces flavus TaxID=1708749 RepID=A0ABV7Y1W5_9ACTN|nr:DUF4190 domain-containing protein [Tenggerimyces flavus]MBM7790904.1 hypothetical protein [Tenggerimyces flavus]
MSDERAGGDPAPIPSEGTSAPPDANRVFGQAPPSHPFSAPAGGPGGDGPPPVKLSEADDRKLRIRARLAVIFGAGALIFAVLAFPLGLILGVAAIVLGALARRSARPARVRAPGAVPGIVLGIVATVFASFVAVTAAVFWDEVSEYYTCMEGANTRTSQEGCQETMRKRLTERLEADGSAG